MHVVAIATQKGGSGKTTLARNLAVAAGKNVALIDRDPQGSLTSWWNRRQAETPALATVPKGATLAQVVDELRTSGIDMVIIDTPPAANAGMREVLAVSDFVLVPVRPSPDDLDAVAATLETLKFTGKPFSIVISQALPRTRLAREAAPELAGHGVVAPIAIAQRVEYANAAIQGLGVTESSIGPASDEIKALLTYLRRQLAKRKSK